MPITNLLKETYLGLELDLVLYKLMIILSLKIKKKKFLFTRFLKLFSVLYTIFSSIFINTIRVLILSTSAVRVLNYAQFV